MIGLLCVGLITSTGLSAVTFTWDDGFNPDDLWSTKQNWAGNTVPTSASDTELVFVDGTLATNDLGNFTLEKITFDAALGSNSFLIEGDTIDFAGTHDIDINHSGFATISNNLTSSSNLQIRGNNAGTLTIAGDITGGFMTKFDNHTLILSGDNSFTNRIRIRGGIVESQSANALGAPNRVDFEDDLGGGQTPTLFISTVDQTYGGTLRAEGGDNGYIDVASGITFTVNGSGDALDWINSGSAFFKQGAGTLALDKASSGDGLLTIQQGTVQISNGAALGGTASGVVIQSGGTLELSGGITVTGESLTLAGIGHGGTGALANVFGDNLWDGDLTFTADTTIANNAGSSTLTVGQFAANRTVDNAGFDLTINGSGDITFNSQFTGTGGFVKNGSGTTLISYGGSFSNTTYSGTTTVNEGTLIADLGASPLTPLTGDINIGDGVGTDTFQTRWLDNIGDNTNVRVNSSGVLEVGGFYNNNITETIGSLTLEGGALAQSVDGASTVSSIVLNGNVTRVATGNSTATIAGNLDLGGATRTFDVADSTATIDLDVSATLSNGDFNKTGAGNLALTGSSDNTHSSTTVNAGSLTLNKTAGVDAASGSLTVNGGTLLLGASNQIEDSTAMTLTGGSFDTMGNSDTLGTLTLSGTSSIDLGSGGTLSFDASNGESWSGSLSITNWDGDENGGGTTQLFFGSNNSGLNQGQIDSIQFVNPSGFSPGTYGAKILSSGELVPFNPIPEPSTYLSGTLLLLAGVFYHFRRKR